MDKKRHDKCIRGSVSMEQAAAILGLGQGDVRIARDLGFLHPPTFRRWRVSIASVVESLEPSEPLQKWRVYTQEELEEFAELDELTMEDREAYDRLGLRCIPGGKPEASRKLQLKEKIKEFLLRHTKLDGRGNRRRSN